MGVAMANAIRMGLIKSFVSKTTIDDMLAPEILRIPISFVRCVVTKDASPNNPRQAIIMARKANNPKFFQTAHRLYTVQRNDRSERSIQTGSREKTLPIFFLPF
jgi:hypothetical protein